MGSGQRNFFIINKILSMTINHVSLFCLNEKLALITEDSRYCYSNPTTHLHNNYNNTRNIRRNYNIRNHYTSQYCYNVALSLASRLAELLD